MSRKDKRLKENILKKIFKKGNISEEKKEEIRAAISALDINTILSNPSILAELKANPSRLSEFTKSSDEALDSEPPATSEETQDNAN